MKTTKILLLMLAGNTIMAQVGLNTANPQGTFHIDGKSSLNTINPINAEELLNS